MQSSNGDLQAESCGIESMARGEPIARESVERHLSSSTRSSHADHLNFLADVCSEQARRVSMAMQDLLCLKSDNATRAWQRLQERRADGSELKASRQQRQSSLCMVRMRRASVSRRPSSAPPVLRTPSRARSVKRRPLRTSPSNGYVQRGIELARTGSQERQQSLKATPPCTPKPGGVRSSSLARRNLVGKEAPKSFSSVFGGAVAGLRQVEAMAAENQVSHFDLLQLGIEFNMPQSQVTLAKEIFDNLDMDGNGMLDFEEFQEAILKLLKGKPVSKRSVQRRCQEHWAGCDYSRTGVINFISFLKWFASNPFIDYDAETQCMMNLAQRFNVPVQSIQEVKLAFDAVDTSQSGLIDFEDFSTVLAKIMCIDELPRFRARSLWLETHGQMNSSVLGFEKFARWWLNRRDALLPYEDFYGHVRRIGSRHLDPPAYPEMEEDFGTSPGSF